MIKIPKIKNIILSLTTVLLLAACGGGGSSDSSASTTKNTNSINTTVASDYSAYQWGAKNNINPSFQNTYNINSNAHININSAWSKTKGKYTVAENINQKVKVAIIDEDFEVTHPDIKDKIISSFNAMDDSSNIGDSDGDTFYHGLAVAGFVASTYLGVAPDVELILINIDLNNDSLTAANIIKAFDHAQAQGAKVINCSWGGRTLSNAVQNKISALKNAGITIIFASGNGDSLGLALDLDEPGNNDPAELNTVIGVGATNVLNDVATYSNYGSTIDIIAPGGGGKSARSNLLGVLGLDATGNAGANNATDTIAGNNLVNNNYTFTSGTSFSAPIASGVIALMIAVNPKLTPDDIRRILITTTEKVGTENGANYSINDFDTTRAYGKIHASNAVNKASAEYTP